jgi:acetoin utilization deacetylase AcuC-like enzyme
LLTFYNEHHAQHRGRFEFFRGELVPCFEKPERAELVLKEFERRGLGRIVTPHRVPLVSLERIHSPRYLHFLRNAWSEWIALDPANADQDAFPAVWPVRTLRDDVEPENFCARLGLYSMDSGTPLTAGTWTAAKTGADCAVNAAHALRLGERASFATSCALASASRTSACRPRSCSKAATPWPRWGPTWSTYSRASRRRHDPNAAVRRVGTCAHADAGITNT